MENEEKSHWLVAVLNAIHARLIFLLLGVVFLLLTFFRIHDITKADISTIDHPSKPTLGLGVAFLVAGYLLDRTYRRSRGIEKIENGWRAKVNRTTIDVIFGRIESFKATEPDAAVVLPANEYFDDECINDMKSALGAYAGKWFASDLPKFRQLVRNSVKGWPSEKVEKEVGVSQPSYGVGKCLCLERPLQVDTRLLILSVTKKRAGQGMRATAGSLHDGMAEVFRLANDKKLYNIRLPLMGSGHGGMRPSVALLHIILAIAEGAQASGEHNRHFAVVIFRADDKSKPVIESNTARRVLEAALNTIQEA